MSAHDEATKEQRLWAVMAFSKGPDTLHQCGPYYTSLYDAQRALDSIAVMDERVAAKLTIYAIAAQEME